MTRHSIMRAARRLTRWGLWGLLLVLLAAVPAVSFAQEHEHTAQQQNEVSSSDGESAREIWTCSMHPQIRLPNPGKCPICGMDLIPLKQEGGAGAGAARSMREVTLSPYAEKLAAIQVQPVIRKFVETSVRMVGKVTYDETRVATITAWVPGRLDKMYVDFTGVRVKQGDPMVYLYSPELITAQQELLQAIRTSGNLGQSGLDSIKDSARATVNASREKLRLWGLDNAQIEAVVKRGRPTDHMTIMAPISGVVIRKEGLEGAYVKTGSLIYTIADLSQVWVKLDAYESDLAWVRQGQPVEFQTEAYPAEVFTGTVAFIDPFLDPKTRTVKVRLNAPNPAGKLKPELFVRAVLKTTLSADGTPLAQADAGHTPPLVIPAGAPLITGKRAVVYVSVPDRPGVYEGREIVLGPRAGNYYLVVRGLEAGEQVVTRGNFKLDSAIQILAKPSMMTPEGGGGGGGHQHGDAAPKPQAGAAPTRGLEAPAAFKQQLRQVVSAYNQMAEPVQTEDLNRARSAFAALQKALQAVDMKLVTDHPHMVWMELAMLLENDAVIGHGATSPKAAALTFRDTTLHIERLQQQFALDHGAHAGQPAASASKTPVPEALRREVGRLLDAYLVAQNALAEDRFEPARNSMQGLRGAIRAINLEGLDAAARGKWQPFLNDLEQALAQLDASENLDLLRRCFAPLSEAMAMVVETFGVQPQTTVYQLRCPMIFDGKGATWLQLSTEIHNPYYGNAMPGCGEVLRTIASSGGAAHKEHPHD